MVDLLFSAGRLLAALLLVLLNGFFVASEFALVRVRSTAVDRMVEEGRAGATTLQDALGSLDDYLAATQLGITVASLGLGWIGEPAVAALIEPLLAPVVPAGTLHLIAIVIGFSTVTFLHVVFGELAPKTIAIADAERLALLVSPPMKFFYYLFLPGLVVFNGTANRFTSLIGVPPASETEETLSEEEIRMVLSRAGEKGHVTAEEVSMIDRVFELDDVTARAVMVPQPNVATIPAETPFDELRTLAVEHGHTRYPVVEGDAGDEVVGYVDVKDILRAAESGDTGSLSAADLAKDVPMVPETTPVDELLETFQGQQRQMAAVIDEWGTLEGIATVEDVVEVVVGDIRDEFDERIGEPSIRSRDDGAYTADGALSIQKVNDVLETDFENASYGTVGGLVFDLLGHPPEVGDAVEAGGYRLEVQAVDGVRVEEVTIRPLSNDRSTQSE
ncbi:hemolysin family protein [Halorientalis brevis]|uniref:Hemolysin family protein n=1 Tax=Halorientalis brevis TaxID=1126241 RepID=A0ABD6C9N7_9EURY|nr:hemolysin family protein [Halorientalis brevis]